MKHYKIVALFDEFFPYLKSQMQPKERFKLCILFKPANKEQPIYISTEDDSIKEAILNKYEMIPCDSPYSLYMENTDDWNVLGNKSLMQDA